MNLHSGPRDFKFCTVVKILNGKRNSEELLKYVYEILNEKHNLGVMITDNKGNASRPCPPDLLQNMAEKCDVVITASGD